MASTLRVNVECKLLAIIQGSCAMLHVNLNFCIVSLILRVWGFHRVSPIPIETVLCQ